MWQTLSSSPSRLKSIRDRAVSCHTKPTQHTQHQPRRRLCSRHQPQITTPCSPGSDREHWALPSSWFCCLLSQKLSPTSTLALCTDLPGWQFELRVSPAQLRSSSIPGSSNKLPATLGKSPVLGCFSPSAPINKPRWHRKTRLYSRMPCSVGQPRGGGGPLASCTELQEDACTDDLKPLRSHRPESRSLSQVLGTLAGGNSGHYCAVTERRNTKSRICS